MVSVRKEGSLRVDLLEDSKKEPPERRPDLPSEASAKREERLVQPELLPQRRKRPVVGPLRRAVSVRVQVVCLDDRNNKDKNSKNEKQVTSTRGQHGERGSARENSEQDDQMDPELPSSPNKESDYLHEPSSPDHHASPSSSSSSSSSSASSLSPSSSSVDQNRRNRMRQLSASAPPPDHLPLAASLARPDLSRSERMTSESSESSFSPEIEAARTRTRSKINEDRTREKKSDFMSNLLASKCPK